jgi:hypothetical protein
MKKVPQQSRRLTTLMVMSGAGVGALVFGAGLAWVILGPAPSGEQQSTISTTRPSETIRVSRPPQEQGKSTQTTQPVVPPPDGTIRRLEAISGSFSKK